MVKIQPQDQDFGFDGTNVERFLDSYQLAAELDGASDYDMAHQICFFMRTDELMDVVEALDGFEDHDWERLKASMLLYWGREDVAQFTVQDLEDLLLHWSAREGISPVEDYPSFCQSFESIACYLLKDENIDEEGIQTLAHKAFCLAYRCSLLSSSSSLEETDRPPPATITTRLEPSATRFGDVLPEEFLELNKEDWDVESEPSDQAHAESNHTFSQLSQPPVRLNVSCGSWQPFVIDPPAVVAFDPFARVNQHNPAREQYENFKSSKVLSASFPPGLGPLKEFTRMATESAKKLHYMEFLPLAFPPGLGFVEVSACTIPDMEEDRSANSEIFKQLTEEFSHPEVVQSESTSSSSPSSFPLESCLAGQAPNNQMDSLDGGLRSSMELEITQMLDFKPSTMAPLVKKESRPADVGEKVLRLDLSEPLIEVPQRLTTVFVQLPNHPKLLNVTRGGNRALIPLDLLSSYDFINTCEGSVPHINTSKSFCFLITTGKVNLSYAQRRTGVGPDRLLTSKGRLRNEARISRTLGSRQRLS
ncbi:hypothetical protein PtB15_4B592 [Puccinia triticina]|nr:hypothetical protein PtB15_4B592 [Puccinia triticina]